MMKLGWFPAFVTWLLIRCASSGFLAYDEKSFLAKWAHYTRINGAVAKIAGLSAGILAWGLEFNPMPGRKGFPR